MALLKVFGLTADVVDAEAFLASNQKLQAIDEMLGTAAVRRDGSMREIERRREDGVLPRTERVVEAKVVKPILRRRRSCRGNMALHRAKRCQISQ